MLVRIALFEVEQLCGALNTRKKCGFWLSGRSAFFDRVGEPGAGHKRVFTG